MISVTEALANKSFIIIEEACEKYDAYDCDLVKAVVWRESSYKLNLKHIDTDGEIVYGGMSIKCDTARMVGLKYSCDQLRNPLIGLRFGILYLEKQLDRYGYDIPSAIAAYNAGKAYVCKNINYKHGNVLCYPGEFVNQTYVWKVIRRYKWIKSKYSVLVTHRNHF